METHRHVGRLIQVLDFRWLQSHIHPTLISQGAGGGGRAGACTQAAICSVHTTHAALSDLHPLRWGVRTLAMQGSWSALGPAPAEPPFSCGLCSVGLATPSFHSLPTSHPQGLANTTRAGSQATASWRPQREMEADGSLRS